MIEPESRPGAGHAPRAIGERRAVAFVMSTLWQPAWVVDTIRVLLDDAACDVRVVLEPESARVDAGDTHRSGPRRGLLAMYDAWDGRRVPADHDPLRVRDVTDVVGAARVIRGDVRAGEFAAGFSVLEGQPSGLLLSAFEHGLLSLAGGTQGLNAAAERAVLSGAHALESTLLHWRRDDARPVEHVQRVRIDRLSVAVTRRLAFDHLAAALAARLTAIGAGTACDAGRALSPPAEQSPSAARGSARQPAALPSLLRLGALRVARGARAKLYREDWALAVAKTDGASPLTFDPRSGGQAPKLIVPPADRIWADPFAHQRDGRTFVFHEEMQHDSGRAHIAVLELTSDLQARPLGPVLKAPYHLSYPFIFEWNGSLFMLPETEQNRTIEVHRCVSWPDEWTLEAVLLQDVSAVDATIEEVDGTWWMFATLNTTQHGDWDSDLHIYHAPTPLGPWTPHACNPVKMDVGSARSAGRLFRHAGRLYRPAQDCAPRYGYGIVMNEVLRLGPTVFSEAPAWRITPWASRVTGVHTVNQCGPVLLLDCRLRRRRPTQPPSPPDSLPNRAGQAGR